MWDVNTRFTGIKLLGNRSTLFHMFKLVDYVRTYNLTLTYIMYKKGIMRKKTF